MTMRRIVSSRVVILTVPDERKAEAVHEVLEGPVTNMWPASILQRAPQLPPCFSMPPRRAGSTRSRP